MGNHVWIYFTHLFFLFNSIVFPVLRKGNRDMVRIVDICTVSTYSNCRFDTTMIIKLLPRSILLVIALLKYTFIVWYSNCESLESNFSLSNFSGCVLCSCSGVFVKLPCYQRKNVFVCNETRIYHLMMNTSIDMESKMSPTFRFRHSCCVFSWIFDLHCIYCGTFVFFYIFMHLHAFYCVQFCVCV